MSTYPGEADGHDIDIDYEDCSDELDMEKVRWGMGMYEGLALELKDQVIAELKHALAEKDREIEAKETELGKLDAELIVLRGTYQQLMEKAVRFAIALVGNIANKDEIEKEAIEFLASPEAEAWKE